MDSISIKPLLILLPFKSEIFEAITDIIERDEMKGS